MSNPLSLIHVHVHTGSYSDSRGIEIIRKHVAEFISRRDGVPCDFKNVYLVNGASDGIKTMLYVVMGDECSPSKTGVMIPTPQYPLYTAALAELGARPVSHDKSMNEEKLISAMHIVQYTSIHITQTQLCPTKFCSKRGWNAILGGHSDIVCPKS